MGADDRTADRNKMVALWRADWHRSDAICRQAREGIKKATAEYERAIANGDAEQIKLMSANLAALNAALAKGVQIREKLIEIAKENGITKRR